jgi:hypothetical protein
MSSDAQTNDSRISGLSPDDRELPEERTELTYINVGAATSRRARRG